MIINVNYLKRLFFATQTIICLPLSLVIRPDLRQRGQQIGEKAQPTARSTNGINCVAWLE